MKKVKIFLSFIVIIIIFLIVANLYCSYKENLVIPYGYYDKDEFDNGGFREWLIYNKYYYTKDFDSKFEENERYELIGSNIDNLRYHIRAAAISWDRENELEEIYELLQEKNYFYLIDKKQTEREYNFTLYIYDIENHTLVELESIE